MPHPTSLSDLLKPMRTNFSHRSIISKQLATLIATTATTRSTLRVNEDHPTWQHEELRQLDNLANHMALIARSLASLADIHIHATKPQPKPRSTRKQ